MLCIDIEELFVDQGRNLSIECLLPITNSSELTGDVMWIWEEREDGQNERLQVQPDGTLLLMNVKRNDSGLYECSLADPSGQNLTYQVRVKVRSKSFVFKFFLFFLC